MQKVYAVVCLGNAGMRQDSIVSLHSTWHKAETECQERNNPTDGAIRMFYYYIEEQILDGGPSTIDQLKWHYPGHKDPPPPIDNQLTS